ncbi:MAG: hypothetical protein ABSB19_13740 [Methylomonas sp.]|jgi:hypothetical protein
MTKIFLDIQTIPMQDETLIAQITQSIKPPGNYSQPDSIARWYKENLRSEAERRYRQTALDGLYGEICSIAWALDEGEVTVFWRDGLSGERGLLENFMAELAALEDGQGRRRFIRTWVGHFISGFDLRFLWQRCVINRVRPSVALPIDAKPWDDRIFDTCLVWSGTHAGGGQSSLAALSQAFGLECKPGLDGGRVYQDWLAGRYEAIAEYNRLAVANTRELYRRMNFSGK